LCIAFCDVADFVADHFPSVVPLTLANEFALQRACPIWDLRVRNEDEYFEVLKAAYLIMTTRNSVFPLRRLKGLMPLWLILQIWLEGPIGNGRYKVWYRRGVGGSDI